MQSEADTLDPPTPVDSSPCLPPRRLPSHLQQHLHRSDSLRSDQTDASSEARRVSFNSDVKVKKIPKSSGERSARRPHHHPHHPPAPPPLHPKPAFPRPSEIDSGPFAENVRRESPPSDEDEIAVETARILSRLQGVQCRAAPTLDNSNNPPPHVRRPQTNISIEAARQQQQQRHFSPPPPSNSAATPTPSSPPPSNIGADEGDGDRHQSHLPSSSVSLPRPCTPPPHPPPPPPLQSNAASRIIRPHPILGGGGNKWHNHSGSEAGDSGLQAESSLNSGGGGSGGVGGESAMQTGESFSSSITTTTNECASSSSGGGGSDGITRNSRNPVPKVRSASSDNRLFGLHALNNLDIAVNGKDVNSMPSYHEVRRASQHHHPHHQHQQYLDSSGNSAEYSPPSKRSPTSGGSGGSGSFVSPPKPPRSKAPSASPPSVRRMATAANGDVPHYAQPERSTKMVTSMMEQLSQDSRFRRRLAETSGDDDVTSSIYSSAAAAPRHHMHPPPPVTNPYLQRMDSRESPSSRLSPSRTCMTDTELLRSPTEVLYAVSDKYRHHGNENVAHSASQTSRSELHHPHHNGGPVGGSRGVYDRRSTKAAANSREDLLSDAPSSSVAGRGARSAGTYHHPPSRSLDRYRNDNKENSFKARILVTSPDRGASPSQAARKPYKTTINTANDDIIQYRGSMHHGNGGVPGGSSRGQQHQRQLFQKNQMYRRPESEHYKVPKSKAVPVEYLRNGGVRHHHPGLIMGTDSDHSSSVYHTYNNRNSGRLVKGPDGRGGGGRHPLDGGSSSRELDREGRTIRRDRGRTYSGCSTSPDREGSPERNGYSRPRPPARSYSSSVHHQHQNRSPSTSPTRPPRARSSPGRELITNVVRRVTNRGVERHPSNRASTSGRSPFKVSNDFVWPSDFLEGKSSGENIISEHFG